MPSSWITCLWALAPSAISVGSSITVRSASPVTGLTTVVPQALKASRAAAVRLASRGLWRVMSRSGLGEVGWCAKAGGGGAAAGRGGGGPRAGGGGGGGGGGGRRGGGGGGGGGGGAAPGGGGGGGGGPRGGGGGGPPAFA